MQNMSHCATANPIRITLAGRLLPKTPNRRPRRRGRFAWSALANCGAAFAVALQNSVAEADPDGVASQAMQTAGSKADWQPVALRPRSSEGEVDRAKQNDAGVRARLCCDDSVPDVQETPDERDIANPTHRPPPLDAASHPAKRTLTRPRNDEELER
jgi:hypothetical protein